MTPTEILTPADVAERLGKTEYWVKHAAKAGKIPHRRIGRTFAFTPEDIEEYLDAIRVAHTTPVEADGFAKRSRRRAS